MAARNMLYAMCSKRRNCLTLEKKVKVMKLQRKYPSTPVLCLAEKVMCGKSQFGTMKMLTTTVTGPIKTAEVIKINLS